MENLKNGIVKIGNYTFNKIDIEKFEELKKEFANKEIIIDSEEAERLEFNDLCTWIEFGATGDVSSIYLMPMELQKPNSLYEIEDPLELPNFEFTFIN